MPRGTKLQDIACGELKDLVTIEYPVYTLDDGGGQTVAWTKLIDVWMTILPYRGNERGFGGQNRSTFTHYGYIRYFSDVDQTGKPITMDASKRVRLGSRLFNVSAVADIDELHEYIELLMEEGVPT